jgi:hypothetical protein
MVNFGLVEVLIGIAFLFGLIVSVWNCQHGTYWAVGSAD